MFSSSTRRFIFIILFSLALFAACDSQPAPVETVGPTEATAVESPLAEQTSPLAQPESPLESLRVEPESGCKLDFPPPPNHLAVVCGSVISKTPFTKYLLAGDFYLAPVIYTKAKLDDGSEIDVPFISLNVGADKVADIKTESGAFVFLDVPPGEYGVVIYTPLQSFLFHDGTGQNALIFRLEAGEIKQLAPMLLDEHE